MARSKIFSDSGAPKRREPDRPITPPCPSRQPDRSGPDLQHTAVPISRRLPEQGVVLFDERPRLPLSPAHRDLVCSPGDVSCQQPSPTREQHDEQPACDHPGPRLLGRRRPLEQGHSRTETPRPRQPACRRTTVDLAGGRCRADAQDDRAATGAGPAGRTLLWRRGDHRGRQPAECGRAGLYRRLRPRQRVASPRSTCPWPQRTWRRTAMAISG